MTDSGNDDEREKARPTKWERAFLVVRYGELVIKLILLLRSVFDLFT